MNQADRDRLVTLKKAKEKLITQREAAEELGLSTRQVKRLLYALKKRGDRAVIHRLRGKPSSHFIPSLPVCDPTNLRRSLPRHLFSPLQRTNTEGPQYAFLRHGGIYRSDVVQTKTKPWGGTVPPPARRPRAQVKERVGRTTLFS